ncbi:MAG: sugar transferase [Desulfobacterales bacterium]
MPESNEKWINLQKLIDLFLTCLAFIGAYYIKQNLFFPIGGLAQTPNYYIVLLLVIIIWHITFSFLNPNMIYAKGFQFLTIYNLFKTVTASVIILSLCLFLFKIKDFSRLLVGIFYLLDLGFLILARWGLNKIFYSRRQKDYFHRNVLIVGSKKTAKEIIRNIYLNEGSAIKIVGCVEVDEREVGETVSNRVKIIGTLDDLGQILINEVVDEVLIAMPLDKIENSELYLSFIDTFGITTRIIPHWYIRKFMASRPKFYAMDFEAFLAEPVLVLGTAPQKQEELLIKTVFDYTIAVIGLILTLPLFPIFACAIKLFSRGPVFYKQYRSGLYGRKFNVLKFRTMVPNAEALLPDLLPYNEASGAVFKMKNDPRIIPVIGRFLRKTSLDELPQLINILRGEMSIVGPRPPIPKEVEKYELWQRRRLAMKPGITCTWQIQPNRNDIVFDDWMDLDLAYIDNWSIGLDFKILLKTIPVVVGRRGR